MRLQEVELSCTGTTTWVDDVTMKKETLPPCEMIFTAGPDRKISSIKVIIYSRRPIIGKGAVRHWFAGKLIADIFYLAANYPDMDARTVRVIG